MVSTGADPLRTKNVQSESKAESWNEITEQDADNYYNTYFGDRVTERHAERWHSQRAGC